MTNQFSGCGYHRVILPISLMQGVKATITDSEQDTEYDIFFFNRLTEYYDTDTQSARDKYKCKMVMDIDDDWVLPPNHILHFTYNFIKDKIENNLRNADAVFTTHERIAEKIYPYNKMVHVFPNALPYGYHQFNEDKTEDERIRFFWCGSVTHEHDVELLRYPIERMQAHRNKIKMVLGGFMQTDYLTSKAWDRMQKYFTNHRQLDFEIYPGLLPEQYMDLYQFADVCLIPLVNSAWHACKSNLKILEAAAKKCPAIVSNVLPYSQDIDAPVLWVNNSSDWYKHMRFFVNNPNAIKDYGEKLYEWAKAKYNFFAINNARRSALESIKGA